MSNPQSGILPEGNQHALFITLRMLSSEQLSAGVAKVSEFTAALADTHQKANLSSVVGIGYNAWGTKADDIQLRGDDKSPTAHISRAVVEEHGEELEILRHSMPMAVLRKQGYYLLPTRVRLIISIKCSIRW